jgi:8-amino-7-oxononanoate synthase
MKYHRYEKELEKRHNEGLYRQLVPIESSTGRMVRVEGRDYLNFVSNDYLGLNGNSEILKESIHFAQSFGTSASGSRLLGGNYKWQEDCERELAAFLDREKVLLFNSGYHANLAMAAAFNFKETHLFCDKLNHASVYDGVSMGQGQLHRYRHKDMDHLERLLDTYDGQRIIITESLFSMDGDQAPLDKIANLAKKYDALWFVDEAHAVGMYGAKGRGLLYESDLYTQADLIMGAFGKAYGAMGAYLSGNHILLEWAIQNARSFIYTTALCPAAVGAMKAAVYEAEKADNQRNYIFQIAKDLRIGLNKMGLDTMESESHIIPIIVGENHRCMELCQALREKGIWTQAVRTPTVPPGTARLRVNLCAWHKPEDPVRLLHALEECL